MSQQNAPQEFDLATLEGIAAFLLSDTRFFVHSPYGGNKTGQANGLYCPACGGKRRMQIEMLHDRALGLANATDVAQVLEVLGNHPDPLLMRFTCVQCKTEFSVLIYQDTGRVAHLVVLPHVNGGLSTPNTPKEVAFYLDQAYKAQSTGANSAAVAMFRGALEHLLFEQGYTKGMLGTKLQQLEAAIQAGTAPKWAMELDTEYLDVMKDLGNGAIHPNDGDVKKQSALDTELLYLLTETFSTLLFIVYEVPHQKQDNLNRLKARAQLLKK